jgi:hypothetical protein
LNIFSPSLCGLSGFVDRGRLEIWRWRWLTEESARGSAIR